MAIAVSDFYVFLEPQEGGTYDEVLALARRAEGLGFGGLVRSDHYHPMNVPVTSDATDAWAMLAGLARDTKTLRLGTLVSPQTFRYPGEFAKIVATVDQMSGGRINVGMGAGWFEKEHVAFGLPFPPPAERVDRLEDSLAICTRLWADGVSSYAGKQFSIVDAPGYPKPAQRPHPYIVMGGRGAKRTPMLAARFADEFNIFGGDAADFSMLRGRVEAACGEIGRDPAGIHWSWAAPTIIGTDEQDLRRRSQVRLDYNNQKDDVGDWITEMRSHGMLIATVDQAAEQLTSLKQTGCSRWYLQFVPLDDGGMLDIIAGDLAPKCG